MRLFPSIALIVCVVLATVLAFPAITVGDQKENDAESKSGDKDELVPLNKSGTVLLDVKGKRVLLKTEVVLREGTLEMLVCLKKTKEHESILALDGKAYVVHTGLLAIGARQGTPVRFVKEIKSSDGTTKFVEDYKPATGQKVNVFLQWTDEKGKPHRVPGQYWVRRATRRFYTTEMKEKPADLTIPDDSELRYIDRFKELAWFGPMTKSQRDELLKWSNDKEYQTAIKSFYRRSQIKEMNAEWVFAGSSFRVDEETGKRLYLAEGGDVICVANFPTAMLDVTLQSTSQGAENLLFEAYSERIPPKGTEVWVELIPEFPKDDARTDE